MRNQRALFFLALAAVMGAGCGSEPGDDPKSTALKPPAPVEGNAPTGQMPTNPSGVTSPGN